MSYTFTLSPNTYTAGYSPIPVQLYSTDYNNYEQYKYLINLCWNVSTNLSGSTQANYTIGNSVYSRFTLSNHGFEVGDKVLLYSSSSGATTTNGYYDVLRVLSSSQFVIDLQPSIPLNTFTFTIGKVIKYKIDPGVSGYCNVDLQNTIKDFVNEQLPKQSTYGLSYNGNESMFEWDLYVGEEKIYALQFTNIYQSGTTIGFNNTGITSTSDTVFEVGDQIIVEQDLVKWDYTDNYFYTGGLVGYTGTTTPLFLTGQSVNVIGQKTFPYYNGETSVVYTSGNLVVTSKSWQGSTPAESGSIYGVPRPNYNTVGIITSIYVDPTLGLCILTDIPYTATATGITGSLKYADGRLTEFPVLTYVTDRRSYNAHIDRIDYTTSYFNNYVIQSGATLENISTILNDTNPYRVEPSSIGFTLTHCQGTGTFVDGMAYVFYDSSNTTLGSLVITKPSNSTDFYSPIGLEQIAQSPKTQISGTFASYSGNVDSYSMFAVDLTGITYTQMSKDITFKLNEDCSMYEIFHIMWRDKYGSFITMPFIYVSRESIESSKTNYYQTEGTWGNGSYNLYQWDRGTKDFYEKSKELFTLNSGWLYEFERDLIKDMIQSPSVYIQTPENQLYPVQITQNQLEIYKKINEDLFQYTINCIVSFNEIRF